MSDKGKPPFTMSSVYKFCSDGTLCDAVLKVQGVELYVHKVIMSNCSYFRALFLSWSSPNQRVYNVNDISPAIMKLIIEFIYTGSFHVTVDNVQDLMIAANQYNITDIVQTCSHFLYEHIRPENCIGFWQLTRICTSPEVHLEVSRYILDHFEEVSGGEELLQVTVQDLADILCRDELNVRSENIAYEGMMRWIAHMPEQRKGHLPTLMTKIRLSLMSGEYISLNIMSNDLVRESSLCQRVVTDALFLSASLSADSGNIGLRNPVCRPRLPNAILFAIGGWSRGNQTKAIEAYDVRIDRWVSVSPSEKQPHCACHGTVFLDGWIYCIGGLNSLDYLKGVHRFNLVTHIWQEVRPMFFSRGYVSVTVLNGSIYALGGSDGVSSLNSAECYQPQRDQWRFITPMQEQRSDASCTTLHGKVYVCGGFNGLTILQTAECYNPETNQWTMIWPMSSCRIGLGVVAYRDLIYVVGGFDGDNLLNSVEVYNPRTNDWTASPPMTVARSNFGIEVIDDHIVVAGGFIGFGAIDSVEYYDATLTKWQAASPMPTSRSALSCCVAYGLPNMRDYAFDRDSLPLLQLEEGGGGGAGK